jgi:hypothetical protein
MSGPRVGLPFRPGGPLIHRHLWVAEAAARELPTISLDDAFRLVHLDAERESPKFERAAMRWLARYLAEGSPELSARKSSQDS